MGFIGKAKDNLSKLVQRSKTLTEDEKEVLEATNKFADDDNDGESGKKEPITLKSVLGGDILTTAFFRKQIYLALIIFVLMLLYVANRYDMQKRQIEISNERNELKKLEFDAISISSTLTDSIKQSKIENKLKKDTSNILRTAVSAPYVLSKEEFE